MKNKRVSIILVVLLLIFVIVGSTFAYFTWQTSENQKTNVVFTVTSDFKCAVDGGGDITSNDITLAPCECTNSKYAIKREVKVTPTITKSGKTIYMDLWLTVNSMGTGLANSNNFRYALTTSSTSCDNPVSSGTFTGKTANNRVRLLSSKEYSSTTTDTYYLWIWLDKEETSNDTMNQTFSLSLGGSCVDQTPVMPNAPELDSGMIPVTIANNGTVTTISSSDTSWYNYDKQQWANAVLVTESSRSSYLNTTGVTIPESNILAYYVWIPRYKYKIWTTGTSSKGQEQEIEIVFEDKDTTKSTGTQVGEYLTHPAFTFGDTELNGIWVGKFETTGNATTPTIKPNTASLTRQDTSTAFITGLKFAGGTLSNGVTTFSGSNTYGLNTTINSHMMKNNEWGAVAYLSHSKYGINSEVRINNYWNSGKTLTGCGASTANASRNTTCGITYGSTSTYPQSTTGNISGIFDMSGGAWERVMGVFANSDGALWSGNSTSSNSGFNGLLGSSGTSYTGGIAFPESKYYEVYKASSGTTISQLTACSGGYCYGRSLSETSKWYGDYVIYIACWTPWFDRGGYYSDGADAGVFAFGTNDGDVSASYGFRAVVCFA